jgi:hypothetical protein
MVDYCENDVRELEVVFNRLKNYVRASTHAGVISNADRCSCPECASESMTYSKKLITARGTVSHEMTCDTCNTFFVISERDHRKLNK